jgi:hypothetical protein
VKGYDPTTPDAVFEAEAARRYPEAGSGALILSLSANASLVRESVSFQMPCHFTSAAQ